MPRKLFTAMLGVALATVAAGCGGGSSPSAAAGGSGGHRNLKIVVGGIDKIIYLPAILTERLGNFEAEGLDVQFLTEQAGVAGTTALLSGQVTAAVGFYDHTIDVQAKGKQLESVVQLSQAPGEVEMVDADKAGKIRSFADLKGQTLGVTEPGSSTDFLTQYLTTVAGVPVTSTRRIGVGAGNTFIAALQQDKIAAGMTTDPTVARLMETGQGKILLDMRKPEVVRQALGGVYPAASLYMGRDYVQAHPELTQKLANAFVKTLRWMQQATPEQIAAKVPADYYAGSKARYVAALKMNLSEFTPDGVMPADGPPTVLKVLATFNPAVQAKKDSIDLGKTYTTRFVKAVPAG